MLLVFCFYLAVPVLSAAKGNDTEELTVGVPTDRCPVFYKDADTGEIVGIGVDLMRAATENAGYSIKSRSIEEESIKEALDNPEYDIIMPFGSAITSTTGRTSIVSDNLIQTPFTLVTEGKRDLPLLNEITIGMLSSLGGAGDTVKELYTGTRIIFYDNMEEAVEALRADKDDALLHNSYVWSYVLQKPSYSDLEVQPAAMFSMDFRAGTVDTPRGREIIERLNREITGIKETFRQAVVLDYTTRRLYKYDLSVDQFRIEITETAFAEKPDFLIDTTVKLRTLGFQVEMDDFGSGYSSLHMLKEVPVDRIKLDYNFLTSKGDSEKGKTIVGYMIQMVRALGMEMIVEGVETVKQADFLMSKGCSEMQGYYFYKPMCVEDLERLGK